MPVEFSWEISPSDLAKLDRGLERLRAATGRVARSAVRGNTLAVADAQAEAAVPHFRMIVPYRTGRLSESVKAEPGKGRIVIGGPLAPYARKVLEAQRKRRGFGYVREGLDASEMDRIEAGDKVLEAHFEGTEQRALASLRRFSR